MVESCNAIRRQLALNNLLKKPPAGRPARVYFSYTFFSHNQRKYICGCIMMKRPRRANLPLCSGGNFSGHFLPPQIARSDIQHPERSSLLLLPRSNRPINRLSANRPTAGAPRRCARGAEENGDARAASPESLTRCALGPRASISRPRG